jgi:hypothetical protein
VVKSPGSVATIDSEERGLAFKLMEARMGTHGRAAQRPALDIMMLVKA